MLVIGGGAHDGHGVVVLSGRADQGHAANVDIFDAVLRSRTRRDRLGERIEIAREKVDRGDVSFRERGEMIRTIAPSQKTGMDRWVQCLYTAIEELLKTGNLFHPGDRQAGGREGSR